VASEPLASAIVVFPGGASGNTAPARVIQGSRTQIRSPWEPVVDDLHKELVVAENAGRAILTFPWDADGDVAPARVIKGPKTGLVRPTGVAVDPERNLIIVLNSAERSPSSGRATGIYVFNRTDNGNVAPRYVIAGSHTGLRSVWHLAVYGGKIYAVAGNGNYVRPYDNGGYLPKKGCTGPPIPPLLVGSESAQVAVWRINDHGDAPPRAIIKGPASDLLAPASIALDPKDGEIFITDGGRNGVLTYRVPQFF
jgi:DNA-binding beta-propeller fold protein YncE